MKLLDNLNEQQQREHEAAQLQATTAPIGETIFWKEGNASGYVTPTREGTSSAGRYCREFQHEVVKRSKATAPPAASQTVAGKWSLPASNNLFSIIEPVKNVAKSNGTYLRIGTVKWRHSERSAALIFLKKNWTRFMRPEG